MKLPVDEYRKILSSVPIVCVDCVVVNERRQILLVKRANEPLKGEFWVPGGRVHKGERLVAAVHRKMREELGVDVEIIENIGFFEEFFDKTAESAIGGVHTISIVYLVRPKNYDFKLDDQSAEWAWFKDFPPKFREYAYLKRPLHGLD
ncbi:MAG: NUDIX domain-containing protein [Xanthobacteraceae bacterium]